MCVSSATWVAFLGSCKALISSPPFLERLGYELAQMLVVGLSVVGGREVTGFSNCFVLFQFHVASQL